MSNLPIRPRFITNITWFQKTLAGITGTSFLMAVITLVPWVVTTLFSGDRLFVSELRKWLSVMAFITGAWVGVPQIKYLIDYAFNILEYYQKFAEFTKKNKEKD